MISWRNHLFHSRWSLICILSSMKLQLILFLAMIDTGWSTYHISPNPCSYGGTTHYPHPTNCAKFLICSNGYPVETDCGPGTLWNDAIKTCDHARNVQCSPILQRTTVAPKNAGYVNCPRVNDMRTPVFAPHQDCKKYYLCTPDGPQELVCNPGLTWNIQTNRCEWPDQMSNVPYRPTRPTLPPPMVTTPTSTTTPTTTSTTTSTTTPTTTTSPQMPPEGCPRVIDPNNPVFLPHSDCTMFNVCTARGLVTLQCLNGYHWSVAENRCEVPWNAGCFDLSAPPSSTSTTPTTKTTTSTASPEIPPEGCPRVIDPNNPVFLPHSDCSKFNVCTPRGLVTLQCLNGYHWSVTANRCEVPWDAGCFDLNAPPSSTTTTSTTTTTISSSTSSTTTTTPATTTASTSSTEASTTSETTTAQPRNETCPSWVDPTSPVYLPHPDSSKAYICITGIGRMELSCPAGLRWSATDGCIPTSSSDDQQSSTADSDTESSTDSATEPDDTIGTDVPIFG